ncbi:MAG: DUF2357 domain-containing protein [Spirochaetales bacterium]|nr:DUF2357 domain-containing protein [Spirochaetales bacterium]
MDPEHWRECHLAINHRPLELVRRVIGGQDRIAATWERAGTGHYRVEAITPDGIDTCDIRIDPEKISPRAFASLLDDLHTLPAEIALALQSLGALEGVRLQTAQEATLAQQVLRLRRAVDGHQSRPGLIQTLEQVSQRPHRVLLNQGEWVRRHRVRQPDAARLVASLVNPGNLDDDLQPRRVVDSRVEHTVDVYENRLLKWYSSAVLLRLRQVLSVCGERTHPELKTEAERMLRGMSRAVRMAEFLEGVRMPTVLDDRLSMILLKVPAYRAMYEGWLEFLKSAVVVLDDRALDAPLENLPYLYEQWATLKLILALLTEAAIHGFTIQAHNLVHKSRGSLVVRILPEGVPAVVLWHPGRQVQVRLVPQFAYRKGGWRLRSVSHDQKPDVSVMISYPDGSQAVHLFDPKYKLESQWVEEGQDPKPKKIDIDKMHAYRDAIRGPAGERVVRYAATLYPGPTVTYTEGLEAIRAYPGEDGELAPRLSRILEGEPA